MTEKSPTITELAAALVAAQADLRNPPKDAVNPFFKSRYADLATVRDTVVPVLAKHGLAVTQMPSTEGGQPALTSILCHKSGEWIQSTALICAIKGDPQGQGSALTYLRRYALQAIAGVTADDDDDGHQGSQPAKPQQQRPAPPQQPQQQAQAPNAGAKFNDDLKATLHAKNWSWAAVIAEINGHEGTQHTKETKPGEIKREHLETFLGWLKNQPAKPKTTNS